MAFCFFSPTFEGNVFFVKFDWIFLNKYTLFVWKLFEASEIAHLVALARKAIETPIQLIRIDHWSRWNCTATVWFDRKSNAANSPNTVHFPSLSITFEHDEQSLRKGFFLCFQQIKRKTVQLFRWSVSPRCTAVIEIYLTRFLFPIPSGENGRNQSTGQTTRNSTATWQSTEHLNRSYIRKSIYPPWLFDAVGAFALILFYTHLHFQKEAPERMWNWREKKEKIKRALKRNGKTCTERT